MTTIIGETAIRAARKLVASALEQPNIYPQIRSDLMAIRNRLEVAVASVTLDDDQREIVEAYIGIARRQHLAPREDAELIELSRQLA